jgi:hypothetical protein
MCYTQEIQNAGRKNPQVCNTLHSERVRQGQWVRIGKLEMDNFDR